MDVHSSLIHTSKQLDSVLLGWLSGRSVSLSGEGRMTGRCCGAVVSLREPGPGACVAPLPRLQKSQESPELMEVRVLLTRRRAAGGAAEPWVRGCLRMNFSRLHPQVVHFAW